MNVMVGHYCSLEEPFHSGKIPFKYPSTTKVLLLLMFQTVTDTDMFLFFSSVRSSNSHPDLLLTHPFFQITPVLNTELSLSDPLQLYKGYNTILRQSLDSSAGYMYTLWVQQDITAR